jgi:coenzyme PQQ synthesis protein D (PqqD)
VKAKLYVARETDVASRLMGGEMMIMSTRDSTLFSLNGVATAIWEAVDGLTPLEEIVANRICKEYDVSLEVAMKDAEALVRQLAGQGILILSDQPIVPRTMFQESAQ